jgi:hypothetical protein
MPTLRLIKPSESPTLSDGGAGPQPRISSGATSNAPETVPIRLESLPTPLRAVVRDQPDGSMRIEADLPWLAVGTAVHAGPPGAGERTAKVHAFDVEVTSGGSARLVILTAPPAAAVSVAPALPQRPARRGWRLLLGLIVIGMAAGTGYFLGQLSSPSMVLAPRPDGVARDQRLSRVITSSSGPTRYQR